MTTVLPVEGMTCGGCAGSVTKALEKVAGVTGVRVDLDAKQATVEGSADRAALVDAVEGAGFDVPAAG